MESVENIEIDILTGGDKILYEIQHPESPWTLNDKIAFYRNAVEWKDVILIDVLQDEYGNLYALNNWIKLDAILDSIKYFRSLLDRKAVMDARKITIVVKSYSCAYSDFCHLKSCIKKHNSMLKD